MANRTIFLIGGIAFLFFAIIGLKYDIDSYYVQKHGQLISVKIIYVPNCYGTKVKKYLRFQYPENEEIKEYSKRIGRGLCDSLIVGQEFKMKVDLKKKIFLYEFEDVRREFYASGLLAIAGLLSIIFGIKKRSLTSNSSSITERHHGNNN